MDTKELRYAPWVPRAGMTRTYEELVKAWGEPDRWPANVREVVCGRGESMPITFDRDCPADTIYLIRTASVADMRDGRVVELAPGVYANPRQLGVITDVK